MHFSTSPSLKSRKSADILIIPFTIEKGKAHPAAEFYEAVADFCTPINAKDFSAKEGEQLLIYSDNKQEKRILMLGLGESNLLTIEKLRCSYATVVKACHSKKIKSINLLLPNFNSMSIEEMTRGITEGILLANYNFTKNKHTSNKEQPVTYVQSVVLIGGNKKVLDIANKSVELCLAVNAARDLVNGNADDITPQHLAAHAKHLASQYPAIKAKILGLKELKKEKMGLLLAVSKSAPVDPALIILQYRGNPSSKTNIALVGKGVTYDTGGLNLKPTGSMETMRCDMGGAAAVLGTLQAIAALGIRVNVTGVIPSTENAIGSNSFKPGDVYTSYSGKSVEIGNTDAEGRLILADAISFTIKNYAPTQLIDIATLTGAINVALGPEATGLFSNDDALADALYQAGLDTFERVWRMPLIREYRDALKSDVADIKNIGGRGGGAIIASLFIEEFVGKLPWAHLDIASTAYLDQNLRYHPKLGTGVGVRLLVSYLSSLEKKIHPGKKKHPGM